MRSKGDITLIVARPPNYEDNLNQGSSNENDDRFIFDEVEESLLLDQHITETSFIQNLQISPCEKLNVDKTSNRSSLTAESSCCDSGIHAAPLNTASTSTQSSTKSEISHNNSNKSNINNLCINNNNLNEVFNGDISNSKNRKDSSSSSAKDSGKHDETLNTSK